MDEYMHAARANLKLADQALTLRLQHIERRPVGIIGRLNKIAHTKALLEAVGHARLLCATQDDGWWDPTTEEPF